MPFTWGGSKVETAVASGSTVGLEAAMQHLLEEADKNVPYETGALELSGHVDVSGDDAVVYYDSPYAVRLHEDPRLAIQNGRERRWLAQSAEVLGDALGEDVGKGIERAMDIHVL